MDDSSIDFTPDFCDFHNKKYGTKLTIDDFFTYDYSKVLKISKRRTLFRVLRFYFSDHFLNLKPLPDAVEPIDKLSEISDLTLLTHRPRLILKNKTYDCIDKYFPGNFKDIYFAKGPFNMFSKTKEDFIKKNNGTFAVDDLYNNAIKIAEIDIPVYLHPRPWNNKNNNNKNIHRIPWPKIVDHIINQQIYK